MKAEGVAVLLSEQNLAFAAAVTDRAYVIEQRPDPLRGHDRGAVARRDDARRLSRGVASSFILAA